MNACLTLALGVVCAAGGGELFVRGTVGIAHWLRVSPAIIGATVAALATSSPELAVAISSALAGTPQIALGDALGSNVVNVALILGLALLFSGTHSPRESVKRDFPVALLVPILTGGLLLDGRLSRVDAILLFSVLLIWLIAVISEARKQRNAVDGTRGAQRGRLTIFLCIGGLLLLVAAGRLIVAGATAIAHAFGMNEFIIGAIIVAVGTSVPELATTLVAKLRGHDEVGLGTILGSNILNGLLIVATAASIAPISVDWREVATTLVFGVVAVACTFPTHRGLIERGRGGILLALYLVYVVTLLHQW